MHVLVVERRYLYTYIAFYYLDSNVINYIVSCEGKYSSEPRNAMVTSSNGNIFRVTGPLCEEFAAQRPVTWSFDVFFDLRPNKRSSKQSRGWLLETPSRSLWRHCNGSHYWPLTPAVTNQNNVWSHLLAVSNWDEALDKLQVVYRLWLAVHNYIANRIPGHVLCVASRSEISQQGNAGMPAPGYMAR